MHNFPWGHNRRYNAYSNYCRITYGERLQKLALDAGFTCPNRDGTLSYGGCTYCDNNAFNPSYCNSSKSIYQQLEEGIEFHIKRYRKAKKYIAYFQAYSNTHADIDRLKTIYNQALQHPKVVGLAIGTRPDCIDDEKLDYLQSLSKDYIVNVEYGIESCYNKTLKRINRWHTFEQAVDTIKKTHSRGIHVGTHIIFGLPGESVGEMLSEAKILSELPVSSIKFHQLQILKDTQIGKEYKNNPEEFNIMSLEEYIEFIIDFIELLNPNIIIERLTGEVPPRFLAGPNWGLLRNDQVINLIERRLEERNTWQGKRFL